jgi:hypothetical protein
MGNIIFVLPLLIWIGAMLIPLVVTTFWTRAVARNRLKIEEAVDLHGMTWRLTRMMIWRLEITLFVVPVLFALLVNPISRAITLGVGQGLGWAIFGGPFFCLQAFLVARSFVGKRREAMSALGGEAAAPNPQISVKIHEIQTSSSPQPQFPSDGEPPTKNSRAKMILIVAIAAICALGIFESRLPVSSMSQTETPEATGQPIVPVSSSIPIVLAQLGGQTTTDSSSGSLSAKTSRSKVEDLTGTESTPPNDLDLSSLRVRAKQGDAVAQSKLGDLYAQGKGVPQDYADAVKWLREAADQGNADAQYKLGFLSRISQMNFQVSAGQI